MPAPCRAFYRRPAIGPKLRAAPTITLRLPPRRLFREPLFFRLPARLEFGLASFLRLALFVSLTPLLGLKALLLGALPGFRLGLKLPFGLETCFQLGLALGLGLGEPLLLFLTLGLDLGKTPLLFLALAFLLDLAALGLFLQNPLLGLPLLLRHRLAFLLRPVLAL